MKRYAFLVLLFAPWARSAPPDCIQTIHFTNRIGDIGSGTQQLVNVLPGASQVLDNRVNGCAAWSFGTDVEGLSAISIQLESAPNSFSAGTARPGTFIAFAGTTVAGSNPSTATSSSLYTATGYFPWIRVNLVSLTGTGSVNITLSGWKSPAFLTATGGGGGSGTVTSVTLAGTSNQITATGTCTITTTGTCTLSLPSGLILPGTVNGLTITTTTGTITIANAKVATINNSLTFLGTDGVSLTFPPTNATIARTDAAQTFTGVQTFSSTIVGSINGNAGTATALASTPTLCSTGQAPTGVLTNGNATGCAAIGGVGFTNPQAFTATASGGVFTITGNLAVPSATQPINVGTQGTVSTFNSGNLTATFTTGTDHIYSWYDAASGNVLCGVNAVAPTVAGFPACTTGVTNYPNASGGLVLTTDFCPIADAVITSGAVGTPNITGNGACNTKSITFTGAKSDITSGRLRTVDVSSQAPCTSIVTDITTLSTTLSTNGANSVTCLGTTISNSLTAAVAVTNNNVTVRCLNPQAVIQRTASQTFNAFDVSASVLNFTMENCNIDMSNGTSGTAIVLQGNGTLNTSTGHRLLNITIKASAATILGSSAITLQNGVGSTLIDNYRGTGNAGTIYISGAANDIQINHAIIRIDDPSAAGYDAIGIHTTTAGKTQDNIIVDDLQATFNGGCYAVEVGAFTTTAPTLPALSEYPTRVKVNNAHTKLLANTNCGGYSFAFANGAQLSNSSCDANGFTPGIACLEMAGAFNTSITNYYSTGAANTINCSSRTIIADSIFENGGVNLPELLKMGQTVGSGGGGNQVCGVSNNTDDNQIKNNIFKCTTACSSGNHGMLWIQINDSTTGGVLSTANYNDIGGNEFIGTGAEVAIDFEADAASNATITFSDNTLHDNLYRSVNNINAFYGNSTAGILRTTIARERWIAANNLGFFQGTATGITVLDQPITVGNWQSFQTLLEGSMANVTDGNSNLVWGTTIAGGSSNHVKVYFDGTNITLMGK